MKHGAGWTCDHVTFDFDDGERFTDQPMLREALAMMMRELPEDRPVSFRAGWRPYSGKYYTAQLGFRWAAYCWQPENGAGA